MHQQIWQRSPGRRISHSTIGVIGVGVGATEILPAMDSMPEIELAACADINAATTMQMMAIETTTQSGMTTPRRARSQSVRPVLSRGPSDRSGAISCTICGAWRRSASVALGHRHDRA